MAEKPIADGLYRISEGAPQLIASRCAECGEVTFPKQDACPNCTTRGAEEISLSRRGTLWTWTWLTHVEIVRGRLIIRAGFFGLGRTREYACQDVSLVTTSRGMQSGSTQYYDIHILLATDKKVRAGGSIKSKREAEWLAGEIESRIKESQ